MSPEFFPCFDCFDRRDFDPERRPCPGGGSKERQPSGAEPSPVEVLQRVWRELVAGPPADELPGLCEQLVRVLAALAKGSPAGFCHVVLQHAAVTAACLRNLAAGHLLSQLTQHDRRDWEDRWRKLLEWGVPLVLNLDRHLEDVLETWSRTARQWELVQKHRRERDRRGPDDPERNPSERNESEPRDPSEPNASEPHAPGRNAPDADAPKPNDEDGPADPRRNGS